MLKKFLSYYKPYKSLFIMDMAASFTVSVIGVFYPIVTRRMLGDYIPHKNYRLILISGIALLLLYTVRMLLNYFIQYKGHMIGVGMQARMRSDLFNHLEKLPYSFYDNNETGKIMSCMTSDLMDISELAHHGPENIIISAITIIVSFIYLSSINLMLTLIVFLCVPFLFTIAFTLRTRMKNSFRETRAALAQINASVESSISGIRVTKAYTNAEKEKEKFEAGNKKFIESRKKSYKAMGQFHSSTTFVTDIFNVIILIAGGFFLYNDKISFADYSAFIVSIGLFLTPVNTLINFMEQYQNGVSGFERFLEILKTEPEKDISGAVELTNVAGDIEFKNVFSEYSKNEEVLHNLNLKIKRGTKFALVGPSGGGKTTICHLLPRFYDVKSGSITIDGTDIKKIKADSIRKNIGIVQQDIYLFNASITENILYGRPDASFEEVVEAAKKANIHSFISELPMGYDTIIGERGVKLSGGQKQRLSIARVFLKNPAILILDEATSALDNATEILIQEALDKLCEGRTCIVVAHRLSTIKNADEIAVVNHGEITEQGTHNELINNNKLYAKLYNQQFKEAVAK